MSREGRLQEPDGGKRHEASNLPDPLHAAAAIASASKEAAPLLLLPDVLYEGDDLLVVDKPAGLLAVPGRGPEGADCLSARVQHFWPDALVVHRLDMATSGLMLFARNPDIQRQLSKAFAERLVEKRYVAVVHGQPAERNIDRLVSVKDSVASGIADVYSILDACSDLQMGWHHIDLPIAADWPRRPLRIIDATLGKPSLTRWRRCDRDGFPEEKTGSSNTEQHPALPRFDDGTTRLLLAPVTGRTHQLRVHLSAIGHPIVGDALYAPPEIAASAPRLLLHATQLSFAHPRTGAPLVFDSRAPF